LEFLLERNDKNQEHPSQTKDSSLYRIHHHVSPKRNSIEKPPVNQHKIKEQKSAKKNRDTKKVSQ
jgi:hypothetical protein